MKTERRPVEDLTQLDDKVGIGPIQRALER
jgi:hypothetical protein